MKENKLYFVVLHDEFIEIILRMSLFKKDLFQELFSFLNLDELHKSISLSKLITKKNHDDIYDVEIQIHIDNSEFDNIIKIMDDKNFKRIN